MTGVNNARRVPCACKPETDAREFWAGVYRSAAQVKGLPSWTQAGLALSRNFVGGHDDSCICRACVWREEP